MSNETHERPVPAREGCGKRYGFACWCKREVGHDGLHAAHNLEWSDEQAEQSRLDIIRQMRGKTE